MRDDDLFAAIDDEVAALVVAAVLAIFHSLVLIKVFQLAEVRAQHHWHPSDENSSIFILEDDVFDSALALASLRTVVVKILELLFAELYVCVQLSRVSEVAHPGLMREHRHHTVISLDDSWGTVYVDLTELDLVNNVLVRVPLLLARGVLGHFLDLDLTVFHDNVLDVEFQEAVEAAYLL